MDRGRRSPGGGGSASSASAASPHGDDSAQVFLHSIERAVHDAVNLAARQSSQLNTKHDVAAVLRTSADAVKGLLQSKRARAQDIEAAQDLLGHIKTLLAELQAGRDLMPTSDRIDSEDGPVAPAPRSHHRADRSSGSDHHGRGGASETHRPPAHGHRRSESASAASRRGSVSGAGAAGDDAVLARAPSANTAAMQSLLRSATDVTVAQQGVMAQERAVWAEERARLQATLAVKEDRLALLSLAVSPTAPFPPPAPPSLSPTRAMGGYVPGLGSGVGSYSAALAAAAAEHHGGGQGQAEGPDVPISAALERARAVRASIAASTGMGSTAPGASTPARVSSLHALSSSSAHHQQLAFTSSSAAAAAGGAPGRSDVVEIAKLRGELAVSRQRIAGASEVAEHARAARDEMEATLAKERQRRHEAVTEASEAARCVQRRARPAGTPPYSFILALFHSQASCKHRVAARAGDRALQRPLQGAGDCTRRRGRGCRRCA